MNDMRKFLADLGFTPSEAPSLPQVKKRWKELCRKHHPDVGGEREEFGKVTHAYMMITNPDYRNKQSIDDLKRRPNTKGDLNIRVQVPISFDDAFFGRNITVSYGTIMFDEEFKPVPVDSEETNNFEVITEKVTVPPGAIGGYEHIIHGKGHLHNPTGDRGDCLLIFTSLSHQKFQVRGPDVQSNESLPLMVMLRGGDVEVQTMWGVRTLRVPPATPPNKDLRIKGAGVGRSGDHICIVKPIYPTKDQLKEKDWQGLDIKWEMEEAEEDKEAQEFIKYFNPDNPTGGRINLGFW